MAQRGSAEHATTNEKKTKRSRSAERSGIRGTSGGVRVGAVGRGQVDVEKEKESPIRAFRPLGPLGP